MKLTIDSQSNLGVRIATVGIIPAVAFQPLLCLHFEARVERLLGRLCRVSLRGLADAVKLSRPLCRRHHLLASFRGKLSVGGRYCVSMLVFKEVIGVDGFLHLRFDERHIGPVRAALKGAAESPRGDAAATGRAQ